MVKVNGKWLFTKRKIYNEGRDEWAYKGGKNPAWQLGDLIGKRWEMRGILPGD
jgi:hypothetical protein